MAVELPLLTFAAAAELEAWLDEHHQDSQGIWLSFAKKDTGVDSVTYQEAVELGLCFGWIDGQARRVDEVYYAVRYTPRRPRSVWSKRNVGLVAELSEAGRMRPAGLAQVAAAQADGRWDAAYDGSTYMTVPQDLQVALDAHPALAAAFAALNKSERYSILYGLQTAVRPQTRANRLQRALDTLGRA
jgi:uncharacterized protein YdeI (YjbR/CyaY-like superfamily)